ncbi:MAG: glycosyltransferase [Gammaproteobacteria bacterium]|nr:glycosyltransferase [Gammaproteobacteria bacterium]
MNEETGHSPAAAKTGNLPLVSVAIIAYNQKDLLRECLETIVSQDYGNIEIVVADDCSTDGTQEFLRAYSATCPRKMVLQLAEQNRGITPNSNAAHFSCSGKYIAWMGGDDLMLPGKISAQVQVMEKDPSISICYHDLDVFDSASDRSLGLFSETSKPRTGGFLDVVAYGTFNGGCATMVRRSSTPEKGFDERLPIASDWKFWMDTVKCGGEIHYISKVLGRYRRHEGNVTGSSKKVPLANHQDHLAAIGYLMSENPGATRQLLKRQADVLRGLRNFNDGRDYGAYLRASLRASFSMKSFFGLAALLLGRKY